MGWHKIVSLEVSPGFENSDTLPGAALWTRQGLDGLVVQDTAGKFLAIPRECVLGLLADEFRRNNIAYYESMDTAECLWAMGISNEH